MKWPTENDNGDPNWYPEVECLRAENAALKAKIGLWESMLRTGNPMHIYSVVLVVEKEMRESLTDVIGDRA